MGQWEVHLILIPKGGTEPDGRIGVGRFQTPEALIADSPDWWEGGREGRAKGRSGGQALPSPGQGVLRVWRGESYSRPWTLATAAT